MSKDIFDNLLKYKDSDYYPWHMPGHKRHLDNGMGNPYKIDITEIDNFDNLHHPLEIIRDAMDYAKEVYGTKETFYLVNGSTVGILASISSVCQRGDQILIERNCHKSVYNAIRLLELDPLYIYPEYNKEYNLYGGIDIKNIEQLLEENKNIKAIVLTSPSYEGIVIHIKEVSLLTKEKDIALIVDEAHGAHFLFGENFPKSAIECGADLVIQSLHKTLPSLTQTALLHVCSNRVSVDKIKDYLSLYQTSSPSYVFMASINYCIDYCQNNKKQFAAYQKLLFEYRNKFNELYYIHLINYLDVASYKAFDYDQSKLVFSVKGTNMNGKKLSQILLNDYHLQMEMAEMDYVVAITSVLDTREGFQRLYEALKAIDSHLEKDERQNNIPIYQGGNNKVLLPSLAAKSKMEIVKIKESIERISGIYVYLYPPGIPLLVPGEVISPKIIDQILYYVENGLNIIGIENNQLRVLV